MARLLLLMALLNFSLDFLVGTRLPYLQAGAQTTTAPKPTKPASMSSSLMKKLEGLRNRPFSEAEKQKLHIATQKFQNSLLPSHEKFIQEVARISLVSLPKVRESVMKPGQSGSINSLIVKLSTIGGRAINNTQRTQLEVADQQRKKQVLVVREQYAKEISKVTGLTTEQVLAQLPKISL